MKITVVADSHKEFHKLKKVADVNTDADLFVHLGDGQYELIDIANLYTSMKFVFVKGNTDHGGMKEERVLSMENGLRIYCAHGHTLDVHNGTEKLLDNAIYHECKIALYGHTHLYKTELINGVYVMNPGSISEPRGKNPPTYGIIEIDEGLNVNMKIVEIEP
ncbi:MAG: YfcE family phosphodiesterase [Oscillospiraceae bacterium]|nr:YfcE family phosphodiesterase [Oscillospiraceae bacterium]